MNMISYNLQLVKKRITKTHIIYRYAALAYANASLCTYDSILKNIYIYISVSAHGNGCTADRINSLFVKKV